LHDCPLGLKSGGHVPLVDTPLLNLSRYSFIRCSTVLERLRDFITIRSYDMMRCEAYSFDGRELDSRTPRCRATTLGKSVVHTDVPTMYMQVAVV